ncbi:F-BAR domain only protein 1-like [Penaeus monodon]|uniref:F-BAR domain only protein 1-like n=1 Tax=Penaeus monodon TaxID=6687 RepID=UPI0018A6ED53|nr:F-BAR domain only protein 1-like [Penaeus monodon]
MTTSCMKFQSVEESHLAQMLQFVQTYINVLQSNHEAMGQVHRDLLSQYSQFSVEKLLDQFALSKHTGLEKPYVMVFEDAGSLGSAVSGQQSPEPADQSKSSAEDAGVGGGSSSGGVLAGGTVVVTKSGRSEREWSAPPSCNSGGGEGSQDGDGGERVTESLPPSPAKAPPARVTSAPTSPTAADDPSLARSVFRSSKCRVNLPLCAISLLLLVDFLDLVIDDCLQESLSHWTFVVTSLCVCECYNNVWNRIDKTIDCWQH